MTSYLPIPASSSLAYHKALDPMIQEVDRALEAHPDLERLIGQGNDDRMRDNHRNHARFMDNVFFCGSPRLLEQTLPWVYRAYSARGFSTDYFPVELEAWKEAIARHLPEAHGAPVLAVYDGILAQHPALCAASRQLPTPSAASLPLGPLVEQFLEGNLAGVEAHIQHHFGPLPAVEDLYLRILDPVLQEIGRRWEIGAISSTAEHVASALATRIMSRAYGHLSPRLVPGKLAVVTSVPGETHQLGAWMIADLLELRGWDATLVAADPELQDLQERVLEQPPALLALSITLPFHLQAAQRLIEGVRNQLGPRSPAILLGGQAIGGDEALARKLGADGTALDGRGAVLWAETRWEAQRS